MLSLDKFARREESLRQEPLHGRRLVCWRWRTLIFNMNFLPVRVAQ